MRARSGYAMPSLKRNWVGGGKLGNDTTFFHTAAGGASTSTEVVTAIVGARFGSNHEAALMHGAAASSTMSPLTPPAGNRGRRCTLYPTMAPMHAKAIANGSAMTMHAAPSSGRTNMSSAVSVTE